MSQFNKPAMSTTEKAAIAGAAGSGSVVIIGFVIAIIAVILMNVYVEMRVAAQKEEQVTFFRFNTDLREGEEITAKVLDPIEVPRSMLKAFGLSAIQEDPTNPGRPQDGLGIKLGTAVSAEQMLTSNLLFSSSSGPVRDPESAGLDEITLNIDSKEQPPNLRPGDYVDLRAAVPQARDSRFMVIMEYVKVVHLGDRVQDAGTASKNNKYGSITIYVDPSLSNQLFDIQERVQGRTFNVTRRDPRDTRPRELNTGGSKEINARVLDIFNLN